MESNDYHISPSIKLAFSHDACYRTETLLDHLLVWVIAGQTKVVQANAVVPFDTGDTFILPRHQVARLVNYPVNGVAYKALTIQFSNKTLKEFYDPLSVTPSFLPTDVSPFRVKNHALLDDEL